MDALREDGQLTGAISGGSLEVDALRRALHVMAQQRPIIVVYDTTDDDHSFGLQLGCEGVVHLLIEPLGRLGKSDPISLLRKMVGSRKPYAVAVLFQENQGAHFGTFGLFDAFGKMVCAELKGLGQQKHFLERLAKQVVKTTNLHTISLKSKGNRAKFLWNTYRPIQN